MSEPDLTAELLDAKRTAWARTATMISGAAEMPLGAGYLHA